MKPVQNSDEAMGFISNPVHDETHYEYGADPLDHIIAMEEEQGFPMNTKREPMTLRKSKL